MSDAKRALLERRLRRDATRKAATIPRRRPSEPAPLSFAQQRLWFLEKLRPGNAFYHAVQAVRLRGPLQAWALEASLHEILRRHEVLRTTLIDDGAGPLQVIRPDEDWEMQRVDLASLPGAASRPELERLVVAQASRRFDLERGPLFRAGLMRLGPEDHVALLVIHHVAADGWSWGVLLREMAAHYNALVEGRPSPLQPLPIQYADFAAWQRSSLNDEALQAEVAYWREQLAELPVLSLPVDRPRRAVQRHRGGRCPVAFPAELTAALAALGRQQGVTLFVTLLAIFKILLARCSGSTDVVVGSPSANRDWPETESLIGCFVNTLVLRTDLDGNPSSAEVLRRVHEVLVAALAHRSLPFEKLVEDLQPERSLGHNPLFQVMFVLHNAPKPQAELSGLDLEVLAVASRSSAFDLFLELSLDAAGGLEGALEYDSGLFDASTVSRLAGQFGNLARAVASDPAAPIWQLPLLPPAESHQIRLEWNDTAGDRPRERCLHHLFEDQRERTPHAVAVATLNQRLTYQDLDCRADLLAARLRALGVGPETVVAVCVERTAEMVTALLGVLKAGGAYVALDPAYPRERLSYMLADAGATVVLTQSGLSGVLPPHAAEVLRLDDDGDLRTRRHDATGGRTAAAANLAYLIYTSGSTGRPKGVAIEHRSAVALVEWGLGAFGREELAGVLASTSLCFDLSVFEVFVTLSSGGSVIVAPSALALPDLRGGPEVTLINSVPSALAELVRLEALPASVRTVNLAGEVLRRELVDRIYSRPGIDRVLNLYGPSEDTTYSTYTVVPRGGSLEPSIGRPLPGTQVYLLDPRLDPVPLGVPGELHLGGAGLARGYLNRPELTADRFIPDAFGPAPGARLYRTGDLARWRPTGEIEYLGRIDHQVKIRGFRIELGEIETVLGGAPGVGEVVVVAREDLAGDKRLVAYLVPDRASPPSADQLRARAQASLPEYMVPSAFVLLEDFPRTPNGKVDRRALPAPGEAQAVSSGSSTEPATLTEKLLAKIWSTVLGVERIGVHDHFFRSGGHSLLAIRVVARVRQLLQLELPLTSLFEAPTIAQLAPLLERRLEEQVAATSGEDAAGRSDVQEHA